MKVVDLKQGKIAGINFFDLLLVIVVIGALLYFYSNYRITSSTTFSGYDISKACLKYTWLANAGFIVRAEIEGKWTINNSKVTVEGIVAKAEQDRLYIIVDEALISIGGSTAYIENIAASSIKFIPLSSSVIRVTMYPASYSSLTEMYSKIYNTSSIIAGEYGVSTIKFVGLIILDTPELESSPKNTLAVWSMIEEKIPMGDFYVSVGDGYISISVKPPGWSIDSLNALDEIMNELEIEVQGVLSGELKLYIGTSKGLSAPGAAREIQRNAIQLSKVVDKDHLTIQPTP